jgi:four helix bundle protein
MTGVSRFEDLIAWQLSMELSDRVFAATETGPASADEEFRSQIRAAAQSAPALIAEGFLRFTTPEFVRYLRMARGELGEVQSRLETGRRRSYFTGDQLPAITSLARRAIGATSKLLMSKIRQLEADPSTPPPRRR